MAIAALLLWICTAAVGSYLLATSIRAADAPPVPAEPVSLSAAYPAGSAGDRSSFDPPSLQRAKSEPLPFMKSLTEFAHPALAIIGLGFWIGYVLSRNRVLVAIGLGLLLGAIGAGLSWAAANARAAKRMAAAGTAEDADAKPLSVSHRLLALHAIGAVLTLLFAALITAGV